MMMTMIMRKKGRDDAGDQEESEIAPELISAKIIRKRSSSAMC